MIGLELECVQDRGNPEGNRQPELVGDKVDEVGDVVWSFMS